MSSDRLSRHLGLGEPIEIDGDILYLKPLNVEDLPLLFNAMKTFAKVANLKDKDIPMSEMIDKIDIEGVKYISMMIDKTLAKSFPDVDEQDRKEFGMKYWSVLLKKVFEINSAQIDTKSLERRKEILDKVHKGEL